MRIIQTAIITLFVLSAAFMSPASAENIDHEIEKLLDAVGGRDVWRTAYGFTMSEILYTDDNPLPVIREYWVDFRSPRIMETAKGVGLRQTRALNIDGGWTSRNGSLTHWEEGEASGWRSFWPGIPTRVFYLLAANDPSVEARWRDGVIDIYINGEWAVWIATDESGTPVAYGREDRHTDTHFLGAPLDYGGVRLWSEAIEPLGDWRVVMTDYELLKQPHEISFEAPTSD